LGGYNGAEVFLKNLVRHLPEDIDVAFYFEKKNGLSEELSGSFKVFYPLSEVSTFWRLIGRLADLALSYNLERRRILRIHRNFKADAWYINTLNLPKIAFLAKSSGIRYIVHLHELTSMYSRMPAREMDLMITNALLVIGCSEEVSKNASILGAKQVETFYEVIDFEPIKVAASQKVGRKSFGLPEWGFLWVASGAPDYRKGVDYIPAIAKAVGGRGSILWLGHGNSGLKFFVERQLVAMGLSNVVFMGERHDDYYEILNLADGFILTSREDPFPLVMIEAAALGKPIVSFNSGGVSEFLKEGMGIIVANHDINAFISAMSQVMNRSVVFTSSKSIQRARNFDASLKTMDWLKIVQNYLR
ncbi:MAG: glycosyltransferase, partial [Imperialibacter sp.]